MHQFELEQFSGPLDLLLQLIEDQKLDISQVALARVTDQYLEYLENNPGIGATELADFLVVATKLLIIKSKTLLPAMADDEEDSAESLENQLKIYKDYLDASKLLEKMIAKNNFAFSRDKIVFVTKPTFSPPEGIKAEDLNLLFVKILERLDYIVNLPQKVLEKTISLREMVSHIQSQVKLAEKMNFHHILSGVKSRTEVVVCFMALLELIKKGEISVNQQGVFDDIIIERV
ncbi:MAG: ScpA family protein [bacterium]